MQSHDVKVLSSFAERKKKSEFVPNKRFQFKTKEGSDGCNATETFFRKSMEHNF